VTPLPAAVEAVRLLRERGETIACAESLTGGLLCAALVDVPGASDVVVGGVVSYATRVKHSVLGVDGEHLAQRGAVDPGTGVAGPGPNEGKPAGTVFLGLDGPGHRLRSEPLHLDGDRDAVRRGTVGAALSSLVATLCE
jgi:nicotinamide-nucleotide amidase